MNAAYRNSSELTKIISPAAKRIRAALEPHTRNITTGRLNIRICSALRRSFKEKNRLQLAYLKGMELQREHPLEEMLVSGYCVSADEQNIEIKIPIEEGSVKTFNRLVTHYYFEAVLLHGDPGMERGLKTIRVESALYPYHSERESVCLLTLALPEAEDWCLVLKLSSLEGNELAAHTKHYRMKVIAAG